MTTRHFGMKLKLIDRNDGGTFNTVSVEQLRPSQTIDSAYDEAVKVLETKREGWRKIYPAADFAIV